MTFPACKHSRHKARVQPGRLLTWLAAEPFRLFFCSGAIWSIIGVSLWPLFYAGELSFYPGITHARIMIEVFGGAFVVGFLGTAGPRMASAPRLTVAELAGLFTLHTACGLLHLNLQSSRGDSCFLGMLVLLLLGLVIRMVKYRKEFPPPQLLLAVTGLLCGIAGSLMWIYPEWLITPDSSRLAGLLLYQGMLLPPVLGIGSFLFPRILGGSFGEPSTTGESWSKGRSAILAALGIISSFFIEASGHPPAGGLLRAFTAAAYLLLEIRWRKTPDAPPRGTLARGLYWALVTGLLGLAVAGFYPDQRIGLTHLLYIGCFGLLILVVASRVLFGHSGELEGFARRSWIPRILIALAFIAATTRASADFLPRITISHHKYAAWTWGFAALLWLVWHRRRFLKHGGE